jgi:hypothetical protein
MLTRPRKRLVLVGLTPTTPLSCPVPASSSSRAAVSAGSSPSSISPPGSSHHTDPERTGDATEAAPGPARLPAQSSPSSAGPLPWRAGRRQTGRSAARRACLACRRWPRSPKDRRAISGPLTRVTRGQPRSLRTGEVARSGPLPGMMARLPKLIVRVRFSSPAPLCSPWSAT